MPHETLAHLRHPAEEMFIPYATVHIFTETDAFSTATEASLSDRRMARVNGSMRKGGITEACAAYATNPSPDLLIIETTGNADDAVQALDRLAEVCAPATNVIVIGYVNDVAFYRRLIESGVRDYAIGPLEPLDIVGLVAKHFRGGAPRLGRTITVIGTCGGVGASTITQNLASVLGARSDAHAILADFDTHFGSSALVFNLDAGQGIVEAATNSNRLDAVLLERLLADHGGHLSILSSPASLDPEATLTPASASKIIEVAAAASSNVVIDLPRDWSDATRHTLKAADHVVIVASPTLASLRNARNIVEAVRADRPHDLPPRIMLNQVGIRKRIEIAPAKFAAMLGLPVSHVCPFDIRIANLAATDGGLVCERWPRAAFSRAIASLADSIAKRPAPKRRGFLQALGWFRQWWAQ